MGGGRYMRTKAALVHAALCVMAVASWAAAGDPFNDVGEGYTTTHIVVKLKPGVAEMPVISTKGEGAASATRDRPASRSTPPRAAGATFRKAWDQWGVRRMRRAHAMAFAHPEMAARHGLDRTFILEVPEGTDTWAMATTFAALEDQVEYAEVDSIGTVAELIPDDPELYLQYGLHNTGQTGGTEDADIDAPEAWEIHTGDLGTVTVAVIDSGVTPHPEFQDRMVPGINVADPDNPDDTEDECDPDGTPSGHGTHVAGIIAAAGNNGFGVAGVTWGASIMPVRVFAGASPCGGLESTTADGIVWAVDHGADICNISLQFPTGTQTLQDAVDYAHGNGVLVISAAGNNDYCGAYQICFPARFPNSMAVTATDDDDHRASFSNSGSEVDLCAPGKSIYSTYRTGGYGYMNGTSMAAPYVSGLAALIWSLVPDLTHDEIRAVLTSTTDDLGPARWDTWFGHGRINAYAALLAVAPPRIISSSPPDGAIDARQPSDPDGSNSAGWQWVELTFQTDVSEVGATDFEATENDEVIGDLYVIWVVSLADDTVRVVLNRKISVGAWTTITHTVSDTSVTLGYLPGDVDAGGITAISDLSTLVDVLNGAIDPLPEWSIDLDRSGRLSPTDLLRGIDLLNGGDAYDAFLGETLP